MIARFIVFLIALASTSFVHGQISENVYLVGHWDDASVFSNNGGARYNEVWGFKRDGREYAVIGSTKGTHIIEITPDEEMIFREFILGGEISTAVVHRDYHTYRNYMYGICQQGTSTLQISDISYLPDSVHVVYDSDTLFRTAHNLYIDTATAKMYVCGPNDHAMSIYSLADPENPVLIRHFDFFDYVHDAYVRNDTAYLNGGTEGLFIYDMTDASEPFEMGRLEWYPDRGYNHSGWLSEDGKTYVMADETEGKKMKVLDVTDVTDIQVLATFESEGEGVVPDHLPHNLMWKDGYVYVSYYNDGFRVFDVRDRNNPVQAGYYDTYPEIDPSNFRGAWGVYSFLPSGIVLISDRQTGLYAFRYIAPPEVNTTLEHGVFPSPFTSEGVLHFQNPNDLVYDLLVFDARGREVQRYSNVSDEYVRIQQLALGSGMYFYELRGVDNSNQLFGKFVIGE